MISKGFLKSSVIYSIGGALPLMSSIVLLPFYANLLSISDFGILALYISFTFLVQILVNFGMDSFLIVHYYDYKDNPSELKKFIGTSAVTLLIIGGICCAFFFIFGNIIFSFCFKKGDLSFFPFGLMSVITAFFNSFFKNYTGLLINQQKPVRFLWLNLANFFLTIIISLIGLYEYPNSIVGPMWGRLLSGVGIFLIAFYFYASEFGLTYHKKYVQTFWAFCFPLVIYFALVWVLSYFDRFIVNQYLSKKDVGIYDFAIKCTLAIEFLQMGLINSILPKVYTIWKDTEDVKANESVSKYFNGFTAITLLVIPLFLIVIPLVVPWVVHNKDFYASFYYLPIICLGFLTRGLYYMFIGAITFYKKNKLLPSIFFISSIVQIILDLVLIKNYSLMGVAIGGLIIKPCQLIFIYFGTKKVKRFTINLKKQIFIPLVFSVIVLTDQYFISPSNWFIIQFVQLLIAIVLLFWLYKNEIKILKSEFFNKKKRVIAE